MYILILIFAGTRRCQKGGDLGDDIRSGGRTRIIARGGRGIGEREKLALYLQRGSKPRFGIVKTHKSNSFVMLESW